jgi:hypothetical protein
MLRVITRKRAGVYRLELHGMLGGEWVPLLEEHWRAIADAAAGADITVVLSNVDFIDADGERLLQHMASAGVRFVVSGCMNRYVVDRLHPNARATTKGVRP